MDWLDELLGQQNKQDFPELSPMAMQEDVMMNQTKDMPISTNGKAPVNPMDLVPKYENKMDQAVPPKDPMQELNGRSPQSEMNPVVKDYLVNKVMPGKFSQDKRDELASQSDEANPWALGLAGLGGALQDYGTGGRGTAMQNVMNLQKMAKDKKEGKLKEFDLMAEKEKAASEEAILNDLESPESKLANELAMKMGYQGQPLTAKQFKEFSPAMSKMFDAEQRKLDRSEARDERRFQSGIKMDETKARMNDELYTPFGLARTKQQAKDLNAGYDAKREFDARLQEMIDLRKSKGGEVFDREAVARGKQLSKDLLLKYKDMAKLGVLSQADEAILNAIIPPDPLEFSPSTLIGQDPVLTKLEKFKEDSQKDFARKLESKIKDKSMAEVQLPSPDQAPGNDDEASMARQKRIAELKAKKGMR